MKALILGSKGMLGSCFMNILPKFHETVDGREFDITNINSLDKINDINPDVVINCAAYTDVDGCESHRLKCLDVNGTSILNLMGVCKNRKLVHFSTDYVFDGTKGAPYNEEDICNPINTYGLAKRIGEALLWGNNNTLLIRTSWLYGENGKNFVNTILEKAVAGNTLKIVSDQVGSPTYTKDLVFATNNLLMANKAGIFHITNRGCTSWFDFAVEIMKIKKVDTLIIPTKSSEYDSPARRPMNTVMDCCKFEKETGTKMRDWQDALNDYLNR